MREANRHECDTSARAARSMRLTMRISATLWSRACACLPALLAATGIAHAAARPLLIVAAENFYGDVAHQIAGPGVQVVSILQNPDADPHLFEPDAATARLVADADVLIYNGLNYDPWIERLLANHARRARQTLQVAALLQRQGTDANPHLWYDPATMPALARALATRLEALDPAGAAGYAARLAAFMRSLQPLDAALGQLRARYAGVPITATEPVADDLAAAAGLRMLNGAFQLAIMNDTEPGPRETGEFEQSLRTHAVRALLYNRQTSSGTTQRLLDIARQSGVALVGVTETEPVGVQYQQWMLGVLQNLAAALAGSHT